MLFKDFDIGDEVTPVDVEEGMEVVLVGTIWGV